MLFFFFVAFLFFGSLWLYDKLFKPKKPMKNHYIEEHKKKMDDDRLYNEYLNFCRENNEVAMDRKGFEDLRRNEVAFNKKMNEILK